jgi:hypothetical protein
MRCLKMRMPGPKLMTKPERDTDSGSDADSVPDLWCDLTSGAGTATYPYLAAHPFTVNHLLQLFWSKIYNHV